jgi:hypothetical protein
MAGDCALERPPASAAALNAIQFLRFIRGFLLFPAGQSGTFHFLSRRPEYRPAKAAMSTIGELNKKQTIIKIFCLILFIDSFLAFILSSRIPAMRRRAFQSTGAATAGRLPDRSGA